MWARDVLVEVAQTNSAFSFESIMWLSAWSGSLTSLPPWEERPSVELQKDDLLLPLVRIRTSASRPLLLGKMT